MYDNLVEFAIRNNIDYYIENISGQKEKMKKE
jgi:hypothetical protein